MVSQRGTRLQSGARLIWDVSLVLLPWWESLAQWGRLTQWGSFAGQLSSKKFSLDQNYHLDWAALLCDVPRGPDLPLGLESLAL